EPREEGVLHGRDGGVRDSIEKAGAREEGGGAGGVDVAQGGAARGEAGLEGAAGGAGGAGSATLPPRHRERPRALHGARILHGGSPVPRDGTSNLDGSPAHYR